ncbi:methyl-accepting chemotaxis protein, partial [Helicobacter didelphidarum]
MGKMNLGTKLILWITSIIVVCMTIMTTIVISKSSEMQINETKKLLFATSTSSTNLLEGFFNEVFIGLKASKQTFEELLQSGYNDDQPIMEKSLVNLVDSSQWGNYAYLYIKDPSYTQHNIANPKHKLPNGEFLILVHDQNPNVDGGVEVLQADPVILNLNSVKKVLATKKPSIGDPVKTQFAGREVVGVGMNFPIFDKAGNVQGVLGMFVDMKYMKPFVLSPQNNSIFKGSYQFLVTEQGTLGIHPNDQYIAKHITEANSNKTTNDILNAIKNHQDGVYDYINNSGNFGYAGVSVFEVGKNLGSYWSVVVSAPEESILAPVSTLRNLIIMGVLISIIVTALMISLYIRQKVISRVNNISQELFGFFKYLNHETQTPPPPLKPTAQDEIGAMAMAINENIEKTRKGLEQDSHVVKEVVYIVEEAKQGRFGGSVTQTSPNPQVEKLKTSLNEMSTTLRGLVGPDLGKAAAIFQAFEKNDFTQRLENPQGLEKGVNSLGDSICNMIRVSANFAKDLESKSKDLEEAVRTLTESSNTQASS